MNNDERLRDEEKCDRENPEDHVRGAGFDSGSHVVGDDDNEDLSEDEIEQPEFFAERGTVGLNFGLGLMARIIDGRHWKFRKPKSRLLPTSGGVGHPFIFFEPASSLALAIDPDNRS